MNTTKNANRLEKLRKSRSLNDVVSVIKDIGKDLMSSRRAVQKIEASVKRSSKGVQKISISSTPKSKVVRFDHSGFGEKAELEKVESPDVKKAKQAQKAKFAKRPKSEGIEVDAKYVAPNIGSAEKIQNSVDVIHDLHENLVELDASREKIIQQFKGAKNYNLAIKGLNALISEQEEILGKAYDMLEIIAQKHIPEELEEMHEALEDFLTDHLHENQYEEMRQEVYVTVKHTDNKPEGAVSKGPKKIKIDVKNADFAFHCYTIVSGLKNADGYEFEEYCIVLTGLVDRNRIMHYHLNAMPDFKSPGKFDIGQEVTDEHSMNTRMSLLLAHNDLVTEMERKPMPLNTKSAKEKGFHSIPDVKTVHVVDDTLRVTIEKGKATASNIERIKVEVMSLLKAVIGKRSRSKVLPRKAKNSEGLIVLIFSLIPDIPDTQDRKDYSLNVSKLLDLKHALGLPDDVVEDVKKAMLHRV